MKYGLLSDHLLQKSKNVADEKHLSVTINFYKKQCLLVTTSNNKNLLKQVLPITYTPEKRFFAVALLLKVCESFLFRQSKKNL